MFSCGIWGFSITKTFFQGYFTELEESAVSKSASCTYWEQAVLIPRKVISFGLRSGIFRARAMSLDKMLQVLRWSKNAYVVTWRSFLWFVIGKKWSRTVALGSPCVARTCSVVVVESTDTLIERCADGIDGRPPRSNVLCRSFQLGNLH